MSKDIATEGLDLIEAYLDDFVEKPVPKRRECSCGHWATEGYCICNFTDNENQKKSFRIISYLDGWGAPEQEKQHLDILGRPFDGFYNEKGNKISDHGLYGDLVEEWKNLGVTEVYEGGKWNSLESYEPWVKKK